MSGRRRNSPALPLTSARLLELLDRMYDLEAVELDWLRGIGESIQPLVDCGVGVGVYSLTLHTHPTAAGQGMRIGLGLDMETMWRQFQRVVPLEILGDEGMIGPLSNAARCPSPRVRRYAAAGHAALGVHSLTGLNATDLEHRIVTIAVPAPVRGHVFWPEHDRTSWERISAHLGAAFRMRNRRVVDEAPGVIIDQNDRVQHVEPGLADADLARIRDAAAAVHRARRIRMSPEAVLAAWRALYGGRWSVVESVERDGRRLLVARPNAPLRNCEPPTSGESVRHRRAETARQLSPQEARVLAALAKGHSNKLIAYELGLTTSTVGTLLARAARKLGCKTRIALARAGRALADRLSDQRIDEEPTGERGEGEHA